MRWILSSPFIARLLADYGMVGVLLL